MLILILLLMILGFFIPNQIIIIKKFIAPNTCVLMYFNINFQLLKCAWYNFMWCSFFLFLVNSQVVKNRYPTSSMYFSYFIIFLKLYLFQTNIGHCCVYSGVVKHHFSGYQTCLFGFYAMLFLGGKKKLFYFIVRVPVRKELKP